jgi:hypothetical protein
MVIIAILPIAGKKNSVIFLGTFGISRRTYRLLYIFIPRFLAEPLTMVCGTLHGIAMPRIIQSLAHTSDWRLFRLFIKSMQAAVEVHREFLQFYETF